MKEKAFLVRQFEGERASDDDLGARILRAARIATRRLATDGMIVPPDAIDLTYYAQNPVVLANHGTGMVAIGRSLGMARDARGLLSDTQFADTEIGREYAYLYGLNAARERYMRAWSFSASIIESEPISFEAARRMLGDEWDQTMADLVKRDRPTVSLVKRAIFSEYSAVALGADRAALSRAASEGVKVAGEIIHGLEIRTAQDALAELKGQFLLQAKTVEKLDRELTALRSEVASAASRRNAEALSRELRRLVNYMRERKEGRP